MKLISEPKTNSEKSITVLNITKDEALKLVSLFKLYNDGIPITKLQNVLSTFNQFKEVIEKYPELFNLNLSLIGKKLVDEINNYNKIGKFPSHIKLNKVIIKIIK